jgi:hypothetical protein
MSVCEKVGRRFLPVTRAEEQNGKCTIDFKDPDLKDEVENIVECEDRCSFEAEYETEEYEECLGTCKDSVETSVAGSMVIDPETLEVKESTIPISCTVFMAEDEMGGLEFSLEQQEKVLKQLEQAGCDAMDGGWMHPHEFVPHPVEVEEEPVICYVHVKSKTPGRCRLPQVLNVLGLSKGQSKIQEFV